MSETGIKRRFILRHPCDHEEVHRVAICDRKTGQRRRATDADLTAIRVDLSARPCNACLAGVSVGTPGLFFGEIEIAP